MFSPNPLKQKTKTKQMFQHLFSKKCYQNGKKLVAKIIVKRKPRKTRINHSLYKTAAKVCIN